MIYNLIIRPLWHLLCSLFSWDPAEGPSWASDLAFIVLCAVAAVAVVMGFVIVLTA